MAGGKKISKRDAAPLLLGRFLSQAMLILASLILD
jgi:hypothetical protein